MRSNTLGPLSPNPFPPAELIMKPINSWEKGEGHRCR